MSGSRLPPLRPLARSQLALSSSDDDQLAGEGSESAQVETPATDERVEVGPGAAEGAEGAEEAAALPWEAGGAEADTVESELKAFCRAGELVYAAVVDIAGAVKFSVCTVGSRPHNEAQIGELVGHVFGTATALGGEVGERQPQGINLQGSRWSYSLDPLSEHHLLFGIFSSKALPAIVRAAAGKSLPALIDALDACAGDG